MDGASSRESVARAAKQIIAHLNSPNRVVKPGPDPGAAEVEDSAGGQDQDQGQKHKHAPGSSGQHAPLHKEGPEKLVDHNITKN